jgi:anti-sigma regulatory factor (Ser/Thr protein kinase)
VIRDEGPGFEYHTLQDPEGSRNPSGRGLLMIRAFCDEVNWNKSGNEVTLIKYQEKNTVN